MVREFWGHDVSEEWLIRKIGATPDDGASPRQLVGYLRQSRHRVKQYHNMILPDIAASIDRGWPVIVAYQDWPHRPSETDLTRTYDNGHYAVVIGLQGCRIWLADPSSDRRRRSLDTEEFIGRWRDIETSGKIIKRWGVCVGPRYTARERISRK